MLPATLRVMTGRTLRNLIPALAVVGVAACGAAAQRGGGGSGEPGVLSPLSAEEAARRGLDVARVADAVRGVMDKALADSAFPGAVALVGSRNGVFASHAVGALDWNGTARPDVLTLWDMASLTKVVALTTALMHLTVTGAIDVDAPVQRYIPEWTGEWKERVRLRHLLTHSSGLPAWRPLYKEADTRAGAMRLVLGTPLQVAPGQRMVYSDLGAILLGEIVARVSGMPLDRYVAHNIFMPLGMRETMYTPPRSLLNRIAPTEIDPWRQRKVHGEVHDENAFRLDGVSGHAGLFSTAADLSRLARMYLGNGTVDGVRILDSATVSQFTTLQDSTLSHRALGWETASGQNSGGSRMSRRAFGHTGFTGTSMWIDPVNDVFVILLSNRVNPTRENRRIGSVRIALADAVMTAVSPR
ncbi:MAG: serine hydrolase domain-containing protein [Gemmatimonadota bacterium]